MAKEQFPRVRDDSKFDYSGMFNIPLRSNGRLDRVIGELFGSPTIYKPFAAANNLRNVMALRGTIRPYMEAIRNELILKGYTGARLDAEYRRAVNEVILGDKDWLGYQDQYNGVITEAVGDMNYVQPTPDSAADWHQRYNELIEESDA